MFDLLVGTAILYLSFWLTLQCNFGGFEGVRYANVEQNDQFERSNYVK